MNFRIPLFGACLVLALLPGCGRQAPDKNKTPSVAVTTVKPVQRVFHHSVHAWGRAIADSSAMLHPSMAHGGLISALPVTAGQSVHKGEVLLRMSTDPKALRQYRQARNNLELARSDLARVRRLAAQKLATQAQLAKARKTVADARAALQAERAMGATGDTRVLKAPADGVVTALHVGLGNRVAADTPLLDFSPAHALVAGLGVQPDQADNIKVSMPVQLKAVYGDQDTAMGRVNMIGRAVDPKSRLVPVHAVIPAAMSAKLIFGSPLQGSVRTANFKAWAVPRGAVLKDHKGHYLFQLLNGHAKRVDVQVEQPEGTTLGVSGKIRSRLPVIVMGAYELSDGDAVRESTP